jgi:hypothetical protein
MTDVFDNAVWRREQDIELYDYKEVLKNHHIEIIGNIKTLINKTKNVTFIFNNSNQASGKAPLSFIIYHETHENEKPENKAIIVKYYYRMPGVLIDNVMDKLEQHAQTKKCKFIFIDDPILKQEEKDYLARRSYKLVDMNYWTWGCLVSKNALVKEVPSVGGKRRQTKYKKTSERITVDGRLHIVYEGPRGGKFIKRNQTYLSVRNLRVR